MMKKIFLILFLSCQLAIAQDKISISGVKEQNEKTIIGDYLYFSYKKDKAKEYSCAKINLNKFTLEEEDFAVKNINNIVELAKGEYFKFEEGEKNSYTFSYINSTSLETEASLDLTVPKNYSTTSITSTYDKENKKMIILWNLGETYYGFTPKSLIRVITYDFESKEFSNNDIENPPSYISEILSNELVKNKAVVRIWADREFHFGVFDFETNQLSGLKFTGEYKYFGYNSFVLNNKTYFVLRSGNSTSKSIHMTHDYVFNVDLDNGSAEFLGIAGNTTGTNGFNSLWDYYMPRYHSNIICYGVEKYVNISYYDEKVRLFDFNDDNVTYLEEESIKVPYYREPDFYYNSSKTVTCVVDGGKNVKPEVATHVYSLTENSFLPKTIQKTGSEVEGKKFRQYDFSSHKHYNEQDIIIKSNIDKKTKTLTIWID